MWSSEVDSVIIWSFAWLCCTPSSKTYQAYATETYKCMYDKLWNSASRIRLRLAYDHIIFYMCLRPPTPPREMPTSTMINVNLLINLYVYKKNLCPNGTKQKHQLYSWCFLCIKLFKLQSILILPNWIDKLFNINVYNNGPHLEPGSFVGFAGVTAPKICMSPEKVTFQKENGLPTILLRGGPYCTFFTSEPCHKSGWFCSLLFVAVKVETAPALNCARWQGKV